MVRKVFFLIIFSFVFIQAQMPSGPFDAPISLDQYTGPFKPEDKKGDPNRYLTDYVYPFDETEAEQKRIIEINLEDTSLAEIAAFIENTFGIKFVYEDTVSKGDAQQGAKAPAGLENIKLNFKSYKPLTKKELWELFVTFADIAGKMVTPGPEPGMYRISSITPSPDGIRIPLPTYLGTNPAELPDNDMKIRYLYFVQNSSLNTIVQLINVIKSIGAPKIEQFPDINAVLITEKASNIKAMMAIISEIDKAAMPEAMSILKLKRADAKTVADLYTKLIGEQKTPVPYGRPRKPPSGSYFPPNMKVIAEKRTNTLILLGTPEAIKKVEDFIKQEIDTELEKPYSPMHTYYLKYVDASTVAIYLTDLISGQKSIDPIAAQYGGVRDGDKLIGPMRFVAEPKTNMLLILGDYDDYLKIHELLDKLDIEQPQVILRVLLLTVDLSDTKILGTQLRDKNNDPNMDPCNPSLRDATGKSTNFQTSGIGTIVQREPGTGATRLLGDLIKLASGQLTGTTAVTLGQDIFGVWGFLRVLDAHTKVNVVDTPFLVATHKTRAQIISGEIRRVIEATVQGAGDARDSMTDIDANLEVTITPLISVDGLITLDIEVKDEEFTGSAQSSGIDRGNRVTRVVNTETAVYNKEVLAIGGIIRSRTEDAITKVPILGDIPILGWLFKNKTQRQTKNSLVIIISPEIIETHNDEPMNEFTSQRLADIEETFCQIDHLYQQRDPGHRWFFGDHSSTEHSMIDAFLPGDPSAFSEEGKSLRQKRQEREEQRKKLLEKERQQRSLARPTEMPEEVQEAKKEIIDKEITLKEEAGTRLPLHQDPVQDQAVSESIEDKAKIKKRPKRKLSEFLQGTNGD